MDPLTIAIAGLSLGIFFALAFFSRKVKRAFDRSEQALSESASIISVIVDALTSRIEKSEVVVNQLQSGVAKVITTSASLEWEQASLRSSHLRQVRNLQEILENAKRLTQEVEQLKTKFTRNSATAAVTATATRTSMGAVGQVDILVSLTATERDTLEIIWREGPKAAPELGRRINKSREHTSRLMKKLYLEGYVDRETNRAPFRYKLSETARSALEPRDKPAIAEASGKA